MKTLNPAKFTEKDLEAVKQALTAVQKQIDEKNLVNYLKETINNICDRARNKLVAPYTILTTMNDSNPSKEFVDIGIKEINWLCHVYFPQIIAEVEKKINNSN